MSLLQSRAVRIGLWSAGGILATTLIILGIISLLLYTEAGSRRVTEALLARLNQLDVVTVSSSRISGNLLRGLTLDDVVIHTEVADISADSVQASWNPYSILSASFYLSTLRIETLLVALPDTGAPPPTASEIQAMLQLEPLPIDVAIGDLSIVDFTLRNGEQVTNIASLNLGAQLAGQTLRLQHAQVVAGTAVIDLELQAQLRDTIPIQASVNWEYQGPLFANYELAVGTAAVTGDLDELTIQHELLAPEAIQSRGVLHAPLSATARSIDFMHTTAALRLPYPQLAAALFREVSLRTQWSGADLALTLAGAVVTDSLPAMELDANGSLSGSKLQLDAVRLATATGSIAAGGSVDWSGQLTAAADFTLTEEDPLQYLQTSLPIDLRDLRDLSSNGNIEFSTVDNQRQVSLVLNTFDGLIGGYPLSGNARLGLLDDKLRIDTLQLGTSDNSIDITGEYDEELHLDWHIVAPTLEQLFTGVSGGLRGDGSLDGAIDKPRVAARLTLDALQTEAFTVDAVVVDLAGDVEYLEAAITLDQLALPTSEATQRLDRVALQARGSLAAHTINADIAASFGDLYLQLQGGLTDSSELTWQGNLQAAELRSDDGNWTKQEGASALTLSRTAAQLAETCWLQRTTRLCVAMTQTGSEQLRVTAALHDFPLSEFNASPSDDTPLIPHRLLARLPTGISLAGTASGNLAAVLDLGGEPQLSFDLTADEAVLSVRNVTEVDAALSTAITEEEAQHYNWDVLAVSGTLQQGFWSLLGNAELSLQHVEGTNLGLRGLIDSALTIDPNGDLGGVTSVRFEELGWVQAFLPDLSRVSGNLSGEMSVSGSLEAPRLAGTLSLQNGAARLERLGVTFDGINSTVRSLATGQVQFEGQVNSNTGGVTFSGDIEDINSSERSLRATLQGSDFQLSNLPDATLELSPELTLTANSELIHLAGTLDIPVLNLVLRELPESAVDVSRDVVITNYPADQPELARTVAADANTLFDIPVAAEVNLRLGDAVTVSGFGIQATLDGDLAIQQRADGSNLTYGELSIVEGAYRMYGQSLNVRQGKLLFFGALDNPALDIRATREVENFTVGVLMNGTLKNIRSQLFSTPALPDNDILAVLVTGRPYSQLGEQDSTAVLGAVAKLGLDRGEGFTSQIRDSLGLDTLGINNTGNINSSMLTIGKYLTPDIFIHYGIGLFDRQSKVAIDYKLTDRVKLQAESGEYQSLDVTYSVER